ncbi:amino acid permease [Pleurocapsales cyanobacterium LEGE 06147]|nr:amino acid permease [Pleurocapsales cyanobacterium LEGE 06147]
MSLFRNNNSPKPIVASETAAPKPALAFIDAVALIVGIVIGAGIFETPALVAANAGSETVVMLVWLLGGAMSLIGALCYAELATAYPHAGGNYFYLRRAFGNPLAFLFAWARMTVIQTGSIALLAFVFGDYASQLFGLGQYSSSLYAALAVVFLTVLNILGIQQGKWTQNCLSAAKVLGLLLLVIVGLAWASPPTSVDPTAPASTNTLGMAMIFVLLSYGGWNEAVYISAELRNLKRNMGRSLIWSIGIITAIYLAINLAYLQGLGLTNMADSQAVAAELMRRAWGNPGAWFISLLIAVSTFGAINATIITGARTNYALGKDFWLFGFLGQWHRRANTPIRALIVQGAIALLLVMLGTLTRGGFETMVDYTAPVFWFFFLLTGISLFVLRVREPNKPRPFQVPFYPLTPILFCLICGYLLYSSLTYTGVGAFFGVIAVVAGIPLLLLSGDRQS